MFESLSLPALLLIFAGSATAVWLAGVRLTDTTDVLSERYGLGEALGGLILLAIVTNLPEIAITTSASLGGNIGVAVGNVLGGIAIQTVVLVGLDAFGVQGSCPLTYRAASLVLVLEGVLVIAVLTVAVAGSQLPGTLLFGRIEAADLLIVVLWVAGIYLLAKARTGLPWQEKDDTPAANKRPADIPGPKRPEKPRTRGRALRERRPSSPWRRSLRWWPGWRSRGVAAASPKRSG